MEWRPRRRSFERGGLRHGDQTDRGWHWQDLSFRSKVCTPGGSCCRSWGAAATRAEGEYKDAHNFASAGFILPIRLFRSCSRSGKETKNLLIECWLVVTVTNP